MLYWTMVMNMHCPFLFVHLFSQLFKFVEIGFFSLYCFILYFKYEPHF
jgi:hypothetical protein